MVRHLVGALFDVGRGKVDVHVIENMLDKYIEKKLSVVPADGLYLEKIWYWFYCKSWQKIQKKVEIFIYFKKMTKKVWLLAVFFI